MKLATKLFIYLTLLSYNSFACQLNPKYEYTALSAPVSVVIKKLGLISQVKTLGSFHPFNESIKKVDGGIFLRAKNLNLNNNSIIFYDESKALNREFKKLDVKLEKIITRNFSAIKATKHILKKLNPYLLNCAPKTTELKDSLDETEALIKKYKFKKTNIFYLGKISKGARNNLIIANDGFVLDLKHNKTFSTYPSSLAYVSWSSKVLKEIKNVFSVGVASGFKEEIKIINMDSVNINYPGVLIPGLQQVEFLKFYISKLKDLDQ